MRAPCHGVQREMISVDGCTRMLAVAISAPSRTALVSRAPSLKPLALLLAHGTYAFTIHVLACATWLLFGTWRCQPSPKPLPTEPAAALLPPQAEGSKLTVVLDLVSKA